MMRATMVLSTAMVSAITPMYVISHGFRASIPLFISLVLAIIGSLIWD